ncbi:unnamed protein product [Darwinula stevensoni]|uniref:Uncharacterized protein n=1 Tax=Darwinula stevensoni TaxID=69355 RepID=A0A7R9ADN0_9CRUS|nr:unnamed protein product [Darwinula stevensoni]CAG0901254.1 unnamed protein product [Darwinula stevensoni]
MEFTCGLHNLLPCFWIASYYSEGGKDPSEDLYGWDEVLHIPDPSSIKGTTGVVIQDALFRLGGGKSPWEAGWLNLETESWASLSRMKVRRCKETSVMRDPHTILDIGDEEPGTGRHLSSVACLNTRTGQCKASRRSGKSDASPKYDGGESTPSSTPENRHVEEDVGAEVHELLLDAEWEKKMKFQLATTILATMLFLAALWQSVHADGCEESSCVAKCQQGKCETGACLGEKGSEVLTRSRESAGSPKDDGRESIPSFRPENRHVEEDVGAEVHAMLLVAGAEDDAGGSRVERKCPSVKATPKYSI